MVHRRGGGLNIENIIWSIWLQSDWQRPITVRSNLFSSSNQRKMCCLYITHALFSMFFHWLSYCIIYLYPYCLLYVHIWTYMYTVLLYLNFCINIYMMNTIWRFIWGMDFSIFYLFYLSRRIYQPYNRLGGRASPFCTRTVRDWCGFRYYSSCKGIV